MEDPSTSLVANSDVASAPSGQLLPRLALWSQQVRSTCQAALSNGLARKGCMSIADQAVVSANNFFTGVIIARSCMREEFGLYALGFTIVLFVIGIQNALVTSPYTVFVQKLSGDQRKRYTGSTLVQQLGVCLIALVVMATAASLNSLGIALNGLGPVLWALVAAIALIMLREYARQVSFSRLQMGTALLLDLGVAILQLGGIGCLAYCGLLNASLAFSVIGASCGIVALGWFLFTRESILVGLRTMVEDVLKNLNFGKWSVASVLAMLLGTHLYQWIIAGFHGAIATSAYAACLGVIGLVNPLLMGIYNFLRPVSARAYTSGGLDALKKVVRYSIVVFALVMGSFALAMFLVGENIVVFVYGQAYAGCGEIIAIIALSSFVAVLSKPFDYSLWAMNRPDANFIVSLIEPIMLITLGVWLVQKYDVKGAAFGLLAGKLVVSSVRYVVFKMLTRSVPLPTRPA